MSVSLSAERDRIQRQVEELEQSLSVTHTELELLSSETDDESDGDDSEEAVDQSAAGLLAQREKIQREIQSLENVLGPHSPICVTDDDGSSSSSESELGLSLSVDSCLQMNLVYQQVVQETLDQLETLLTQNHRQQAEAVSQLSGPIKEPPREECPPSSCQQSINMFLGRFLKPYFKDKLTGLGPPANQETKEKANRMAGCLDNKKLKVKRWESWQKILLIHSVSKDGLRKHIQPKLSKVDYLSQKLSSAEETDKQQLREQIDSLEREIDLLRGKKEEELIGARYEEHDWQKISNVDFEGTRDADDIRCFWQNFLHPSIKKTQWSQEEVQQLKEVSRRHGQRHWETIAIELGTGRTAFMCLQTFQRFVSDSLRHGSWTKDEDALLRELVDKMRIGNFIPYTQMSYFMEGRDPAQLIYRWNQVLDPSLKRGPWTPQEDQLLLRAVSRYGEKDWWRIRLEVPGRRDGACRDRYYDCLKGDIKKGQFDQQERDLLLKLVEKHGVGRWAKIAAEIPHRVDAQCLREWRKLSKAAAQKETRDGKPPANRRAARKKKGEREEKKVNPTKKRIRTRLMKMKEEEEEEKKEEEEMVVEYMDSDKEDRMKLKVEVKGLRTEEVQEEEEEEEVEYTFPPIQEWTPAVKAQCFTFLSFRPVVLPSSGHAHKQTVRSTIVDRFGHSVIVGPPPTELPWEKRHSSSTLMMVSSDQLRAHLSRRVDKYNILTRSKQNHLTDKVLDYELQAAVTPWIGNLLIPAKTRLTVADAMRERGERIQLSSTPIFLLLLQTMNVDSAGCKEMIVQRRSRVVPPAVSPSSIQTKNPRSIAALLQQRRSREEHRLILKQLKVQDKQKELLLSQQPLHPSPAPHNQPTILLQMPPNMRPHKSHMSFPQAVFSSQPPLAASIFKLSPSAPPPPVLCAPPAPPVSVVSEPLNPSSTCSEPSTQNLTVGRLPSSNQPVSTPSAALCSSISPHQPHAATTPSTSILNAADVGHAGNGVGGACTGVYVGGGMSEEGQMIQTVTVKVRALQDADDAKAEAKQKAAASPQKEPPSQTVAYVPPQEVSSALPPPPPAAAAAAAGISLSLTIIPPVSGSTLTQNVSSDKIVSSSLVPHPSVLTNQHMVSFTSNPRASFHNDHDYSSFHVGPAPRHHGFDSVQQSPAPKQTNHTSCKSDSIPIKASKASSRGRKRGMVEEQPGMTSIEGNLCVGGAGDAMGGAGTRITQEAKRVRKPTQRVKALQEAAQLKAEAMKKRRTSSPREKRRRTSHFQDGVALTHLTAPLSGLCLSGGQSMWVMTPGGLIQVAEALPQGLQLASVPSTPPLHLPAGSPPSVTPAAPIKVPRHHQPLVLPAPPKNLFKSLPPTVILQAVPKASPVPLTSSPSHCPPKVFLPSKDTLKAHPVALPPVRRETLQFDPSLMFVESRAAVGDWLSGQRGVMVPVSDVVLPYLPPFIGSLSTLSALLRAQKSLTKLSLQVLSQGSEPQIPQTKPKPDSVEMQNQCLNLPDSTSDLRPAAAPPVTSDPPQEGVEEAELVVALRQLVAERFSSNPAYQLLKARFLSCFTIPALLATVQPIPKETHQADEDEKEDEEEEEKVVQLKIKERVNRRRKVGSSLLCDGSGAPANHFSGIIITNTHTTDPSGPDQ